MKKLLLALVLAISVICFTACSNDDCNKTSDSKSTSSQNITNYGNGVYVIQGSGTVPIEALSKFIANHPNLELATLTYNEFLGYVAVFKKISKTEIDTTKKLSP